MRRGDGLILDDATGDITILITKDRIKLLPYISGIFRLVFTYNNKSDVFIRGMTIRKDEYQEPTTKGGKR